MSVVGCFLYDGQAIDYSILPALNEIGLHQNMPTQKTKQQCIKLMNFIKHMICEQTLQIPSVANLNPILVIGHITHYEQPTNYL